MRTIPGSRRIRPGTTCAPTRDFERILEDLKKGFRKNQKTWKRLLEQVPPEGE